MNTSKSLRALITLALSLSGSAGAFAAGHHVVHLATLADSVAQAKKSKAQRQELDSLLAKARKAIKEGDFDTAESLTEQAEKMNVEFSVFHLGDTPKKLRADLSAKRKSTKGAPARPSEKFKPEVAEATPAPTEPIRPAAQAPPAAPLNNPDPLDEAPLALPSSEGKLTQATPTQRKPRTPDEEPELLEAGGMPPRDIPRGLPENPQLRRESDTHLLAARRALAVGDVRRATTEVEAARKMNVTYGPHDDTPDRVESVITKYRQITEAMKGRGDDASRRQLADSLMDQAQHLIRWRDYDEAERLINHVQGMRVAYGPFESKPEALLEKIAAGRKAGSGEPARLSPEATKGLQPLPQVAAAGAPGAKAYPTAPAVYQPALDATRNRATAAQEPSEIAEPTELEPAEPLPSPQGRPRRIPEEVSSAMQLFQQGEDALKERDVQKALEYFRQAYSVRDQLEPGAAQRLQDHLQLLSAPTPGRMNKPESLLDSATSKDQLATKQLMADLAQKEIASGKIREKEPKRAMELLKEARGMVEAAQVEPAAKAQLLRRVDRKVTELDRYIADNRSQIELDEANKEVLKEVDRRLQGKVEVDEKLAKLVDDYNRLMDEQRYAEAEVMAKRARELDPDNPLVRQLLWNSRFVSRNRRNQDLIDDKEAGAWETFMDVERAAVPGDVGDDSPINFGDPKRWADLTKSRSRLMAEKRSRRTERELEIERKLSTPVSCKFRQRPLADVIEELRKLTGVNIHLDSKGLDEEGVSSDTPITIDLTQDISLKSALKLILEPLHLSYVIKDEVLKITSEQLRDGEVYFVTYNVADLVIPIPNFVPNGRMGLAGALGEAYNMAGGSMGGVGGSNMAYLASADGTPATGVVDQNVMAQINQMMPGARPAGATSPVNAGPGGAGGGAAADFDSLIELITTTVKPQTWDEVGGPGTVSEFRNNLSLVISQTQDVHEEIVDLLEQLRRNQDLQVTIEVRFITLNDNFFERIGVDFQFNITNQGPNDPTQQFPTNKKEIWGLEPPAAGQGFPNFTADSDIPFRQSSFNLATPQFGQPVEVARFGFAILSDLEAFLLVSAAQGDRRSNVLQAPKVTLFNGQQASVFDQTTTPFVISVIPVVGDFAAAYQPVITVLSEGTSLTVQATISNDRRFVRLTVLPFFSQIGDVTEFTFSGSKRVVERASEASSKTPTASGDSTAGAASGELETTSDGITVQLPNFSFVTVNTTVSVPDGGTVLLGGIKRLSEGRNEFGVPILSKLPYINRLFKNVGIGRETQSLMMMVTPRIIIQEEEEERLGIQAPP